MSQPSRKRPRQPPQAATRPQAGLALASVSPLLLGLLLVVAIFVAYLPALRGGFIWDDDSYVTENLTLRSAGGLAQIWGKPTATPQYYPLVHTLFWLEYHLWDLNPLGYHVVNVLLHTLAAILLWRVLMRLQLPGAWLAAGIFALHPVAVESVAWVTERKNVLGAVFYFASALAYLRWAEQGTNGKKQIGMSLRWYFIAFALFLAALLSKTVTCSLPAAMLLIIWWKRGRIAGRDVWPLLPFFVVGVALGLVTAWLERTHVGANGSEWALSVPERFLVAGRAPWFYAGKLFWPANLTFIYPRWLLNPGVWWQWLFPVAAVAVVVLLWRLRHRIGRGPLVAVLFFGGTLFPALGFANLFPMRYSFVADHFQYLASVGLIVLAVAGLVRSLRSLPFAAAVLLPGLGLLTWKQAHIYADPETLWRDTLAKNPACWMAHGNLGVHFLHQGETDEAVSHLQEAVRLGSHAADTHNSLGAALDQQARIEEAISQYQEAIRIMPGFASAHYNLGVALDKQGQTDEAISEYQEAIRLKPDHANARNNLGAVFNKKGQFEAAIPQFQEAIRLRPDYADAHYNLGAVLRQIGRLDEAISQFQEAIRLQPDYADARYHLGVALGHKGRLDEAIHQFQEAIRLQPDYADAHNNLGVALGQNGQLDAAISHFQEAIRLRPDFADARRNLGIALGRKGQGNHALNP